MQPAKGRVRRGTRCFAASVRPCEGGSSRYNQEWQKPFASGVQRPKPEATRLAMTRHM